MGQYVIRAGEHLYQVAAREGFRDVATVWEDGANAELRSKRHNPGVLAPGDVLTIPDKWIKKVDVATGRKHVFVAKSGRIKLRLVLLDFDNKPIGGEPAVLFVGGERYEVVADGDGIVEQWVPSSAADGRLVVERLRIDLPIVIGGLDPVNTDRGWRARLINLGYYRGAIGDDDAAAPRRWSWAIEEFQCDQGLPVTGKLDGATLAKLETVHGS